MVDIVLVNLYKAPPPIQEQTLAGLDLCTLRPVYIIIITYKHRRDDPVNM